MISRPQALALHEQFAKIGHALSSPQRVRLIHVLSQGERSVEEIAKVMRLSVATVSHHLQLMRRVRLVVARKVGRFVTYALAGPEVVRFWLVYREFCADRLAEAQVLKRAVEMQRQARGSVDRASLQRLIRSGKVLLFDLRPKQEFDAGHLPGAESCPLEQLSDRITAIPAGKTVVLYCRGPLCVLGDMAQEMLLSRGIPSLQLTDGVVEWAAAGLPVDTSPGFKSLFGPITA